MIQSIAPQNMTAMPDAAPAAQAADAPADGAGFAALLAQIAPVTGEVAAQVGTAPQVDATDKTDSDSEPTSESETACENGVKTADMQGLLALIPPLLDNQTAQGKAQPPLPDDASSIDVGSVQGADIKIAAKDAPQIARHVETDGSDTPDKSLSVDQTATNGTLTEAQAASAKTATPAPVVVASAAAASAAPQNPTPSAAQPPVHQVPQPLPARPERMGNDVGIEIARQVEGGRTQFSLRLDPPELGRIEVKLEMAADGQVRGVVSADNAHTYDLLRRDADNLARALADAGLKADSNALRFDLRQGGSQGQAHAFAPSSQSRDGQPNAAYDDAQIFELPRSARRHRGALDLSA